MSSSGFDDDDDEEDDFDAGVDAPTLQQVVASGCKKLDIGAAVMPKPLLTADIDDVEEVEAPLRDYNIRETDSGRIVRQTSSLSTTTTRYARVLNQEFNAVVVEHHLKWTPLCHTQPGPLPENISPENRLGRYDFHHADQVVDWALSHQKKVKGHVLVWHVTSPPFLKEMEPSQLRDELKRHIFTTMGHFRGRIQVWDVVNEALAPDGSLAENIFYQKLGPTYIEDAFRWAHEADPSAILLYNDNKVEGMDGPNSQKADGFYNLLADLKQKDVPVHGCGMQAHFNAAGTGRQRPPTPRMVKSQIRRLGELGLSVNISEMDVRVSQLAPELRQPAQTQIYHDILAAAISEPALDGIWLWGFTDRHTWVTHFYYDDEPCVLDEDYQRKECYYGVRNALATLTPGGIVGGAGVPLDTDEDEDGNPWGYEWMQPEPELDDDEEVAGPGDDDAGDARPDWLQSKEIT